MPRLFEKTLERSLESLCTGLTEIAALISRSAHKQALNRGTAIGL